ncbi:hypothetical protein DMC47_15955 [Nostoc sp. 3335mG]|nr:hypothetical protein DMC47_15955 [Nostoc sp. 3335mG]
MHSPLPEIRAALDDARLRTAMAERRPLHLPRTLTAPERFWSLADLDAVLARGAVPAAEVAMYLGARGVDLEAMRIAEKGRIRPAALGAVARQGATLVVTNLQQHSDRLWSLACAAQDWLGDRVTIGAIASFGQAGLKLHYDPEDLIVLQLAGSKRWRFHGEAARDSERSRGPADERDHPVTNELVMAPGDILYVPAGLRHRCEPQGMSLHLGLLVDHVSGRDLLAQFVRSVRDDPVLNEPFQRFLGEGAVAQQAERVKARLMTLIGASDPMNAIAALAAGREGAPIAGLPTESDQPALSN